ncbi:B12-binding domain-containing radical SAM protein [Anaerosolibacter sp.]|uniref:B12-binding domain-containing radical SAM protein n=1 Tax=Anaerosolibacter sp. TaxID=1872527 RepID=UPI0039F01C3E
MKILLVRPYHTLHGDKLAKEEDTLKYRRVGESLALGYLSSYLIHNGFNVDTVDCVLENLSFGEIKDIIENNNYDIIGFSTNVYIELQNALKILQSSNSGNAFIVFGGHVATFVDDKLLEKSSKINCIVRNEGEETLLEIVKAIKDKKEWKTIEGISYYENNQVIRNTSRSAIENLDLLPYPTRRTASFLKNKDALVNLCTSKGCYGNCSFCSVKAFNSISKHPWRGRSPENVVSEIEKIIEEHNFNKFLFVDDNYLGPGTRGIERIKTIANMLIEKKIKIKYATNFRVNDVIRCEDIIPLLKESGLSFVFIGTESGAQGQLDFLNKHITVEENKKAVDILYKHHIGVTQGLILFDYRITLNELKKNLQYVRETKGVNAGKICSYLLIYHGTKLFDSNQSLYGDLSFSEPISPVFQDKMIKKIYSTVSETLLWGAQLFNLIEDLYWDYAFKYETNTPDWLEQFNDDINAHVIDFIEQVIKYYDNEDTSTIGELDALNRDIITYLLSKYNLLKRSIKNEKQLFEQAI